MQSTSEPATGEVVADLESAAAGLEDAEDAVAAVGEDDARRVADALEEARRLLAKYEDTATGTGDFESYLEFQERVARFVEGLDEDLPRRDVFEEYESAVDGRRLSTSDFESARDALEPAEEVADRLEDRRAARERYRTARRAVRERRDAVDDRLEELRRVAELGDADLDAPVEELRGPIETYDDAVTDAFDEFKHDAPAREVLGMVDAVADRALVEFRSPDEELLVFVREADVGEEPVTELLRYADHSPSKLAHYVDEPRRLKRVVATRQTYLSRLSAEPLTVGWPPPTAETLRQYASTYESVVRQFAGEETVAHCREVRRLTHRDDYAAVRRTAVAREELTDDQRQRLRAGNVADDVAELEAERERLTAALEEYPER
jgi:hypothetical protein